MKKIVKNTNDLVNTIKGFDFDQRNEIYIMGQSILNFLQYYYSINKGIIFFINPQKDTLNLTEIARTKKENEFFKRKEFRSNQGLIGACHTFNKRIIIDNLPKNYIKNIENNEHPTQLICIPIYKNDVRLGVIELAVKTPLKSTQINKIERIVRKMVDESMKVLLQPKTDALANQTLFASMCQTA